MMHRGDVGSTVISLEALGAVTISAPSPVTQGSTVNVSYSYSGSNLSDVELYVDDIFVASCDLGICSWVVPATPGTVGLVIKGKQLGVEVKSNPQVVTII